MSKINPDAQSKLNALIPDADSKQQDTNLLGNIISKNNKSKVSSFALRRSDQDRLNTLIKTVQSQTKKKTTATMIIRGLLYLGEQTNASSLIKYINKTLLE